MLIRHSVRRSPRSIAVFSLVDVKSLTSFFLDRVFRFLHLYQYVLGRTRHLHLQTERALAPTPTVYPPLSTATLVPADQPNAKSEQEPATNGAASNGTQAAGESQHAPDEQPSTVGGPPPLTDDEINMSASDGMPESVPVLTFPCESHVGSGGEGGVAGVAGPAPGRSAEATGRPARRDGQTVPAGSRPHHVGVAGRA